MGKGEIGRRCGCDHLLHHWDVTLTILYQVSDNQCGVKRQFHGIFLDDQCLIKSTLNKVGIHE